MPCSGLYPFKIKRCATTMDPTFLNLEVRRIQEVIQNTNQSACGENFARMCSRVTSKLQEFKPLILVDSASSNKTLSSADGVYELKDVLKLCCNPLSECEADEDCSSHTPYNVQECCSNCESTYQQCYQHINENTGALETLTLCWVCETKIGLSPHFRSACFWSHCTEIDMTVPSIKKLMYKLITKLCASEDCKLKPPCWGFVHGNQNN